MVRLERTWQTIRVGHKISMKAIIYRAYGSPDVLEFVDIEKPIPKDDQVQIEIYAACVNPADWHLLRADPFLVRLDNGLLRPKNQKLGADIAGRVTAIGKNVTKFQIGNDVFGDLSASGLGGFAEYVCVPEQFLVLKPQHITFEAAAATPLAAITALQALRDTGQIKAGQNVLINGASGGVGTFAVQIAKSFGATVTGVCSTRNTDLVRSIGANHVVDYHQEDFTQGKQRYDLIFDAVGNRSATDYQRALKPNGVASIAGFSNLSHLFQVLLVGGWISKTSSQKISLMGSAKPNQQDLLVLQGLLETGKIIPVIDRTYQLNEVTKAIEYLETGRARGKVVIQIKQNQI
jgi:NADPH:quinone reductase-like Zn-dependent oxidoreductase